jgi:hypothetical protein
MDGTTHLDRCGAHYIHHRAATMGETPMHFLDENTKEKALTKEMKQKYVTKRGLCRIIIKHISDATTRMATKIMAYKLLKKCRKEEFPIRVCCNCNIVFEGNHT